jgi:hypothetical protein
MSQMTYVLNTSSASVDTATVPSTPTNVAQFPYQQPSQVTSGSLQTRSPEPVPPQPAAAASQARIRRAR